MFPGGKSKSSVLEVVGDAGEVSRALIWKILCAKLAGTFL